MFKTCGALGRRLKRLPDGESGPRKLWITWQVPVLRGNPQLRPIGQGLVPLEVMPGVSPDELEFGELDYCREARISYQDFCAARQQDEIAATTRFQVSLPTPAAVIMPFVHGEGRLHALAAYERAMVREVRAICEAIPHHDLAIQWDVCVEMVIWDGQPTHFPPLPNKEAIIPSAIGRVCDAVPADVEVGIHLCYGDFDSKHFIEPLDAGRMVSLANAIVTAAQHPLAYLHMPVPISRDDEAYFAPLKDLRLDANTEIYLGLVHEDGAEATQRHIATARNFLPRFGVATECGIARHRTTERVKNLIRIHYEVSVEPA